MQQIADWLKQLGMSEYAERFVENDIDISVLRRPDRSGPQRPWCLARASAEDVARNCGARASRRSPQPAVAASRSPKTPPSAAKSR